MEFLDYEFTHNGNMWIVHHYENDTVSILDVEGIAEISVERLEMWRENNAMPLIMAIQFVNAYETGLADGDENGYSRCQYDVKKVLGL